MTAVALDTLRISKRLREAGFSEPQADAVTGVLHDAQEVALGDLATKIDLNQGLAAVRADLDRGLTAAKNDLDLVRSDLKREIVDVRSKLELDIASVKTDVAVLKWMTGLVVAGVLALILKAFFT